jgi:uridine kinase
VTEVPAPPEGCALVVLLVGPSGCGKSYIAHQAGLPILALDDFYRAATSEGMPIGDDGEIDWEDPTSWDADAACDALEAFCCSPEVEVPAYSFTENRAVGTRTLARGDARIVLAEGIFAAELIAPLRERGLLADALLITRNRWLTYGRRLWRDLREHRKPPAYLVRQGWTKTRAEPAVVAHQRALGARPVSKPVAIARLAELAAAPTAPAAPDPTPGSVDLRR